MDWIAAIMWIAIAAAPCGVIALCRGMAGRRVGDHPFCRRCGFDLFGRAGDSKVCPECGADLAIPRAVIVGTRQRRAGWIATGITLLVPTLALLSLVAWGRYRNIDWQQYKPLAWLVRDAQQNSDRVAHAAALSEILRRFNANTLTPAQVSTVVDAALRVQGNAALPWDVAWADFIERARAAKMVSDAQWKKYAGQAVSSNWLNLRARAKVHRGDPMTITLAGTRARVGVRPTLFAMIQESGAVIDGKDYPAPFFAGSEGGMTIISMGGPAMGGTCAPLEDAVRDLAPGAHSGYLRVSIRVTDNAPMMTRATARGSVSILPPPPRSGSHDDMQKWVQAQQAALEAHRLQMQKQFAADRAAFAAQASGADGRPIYATVELQLPVQFEVVGADQPTLTATVDQSLQPAVERALSVEKVEIYDSHVDFHVKCNQPPPVDLCFKVLLRQGKQEWPVGRVVFQRGPMWSNSEWITGNLPEGSGPTADKLDVVLRPSVEPDPMGFPLPDGIESYWGREVVLKNVTAEYPLRERRKEESLARQRADILLPVAGDDASAPAASAAPASSPAGIAGQIAQLDKLQIDLRDKLLAVPGEDFATHQAFLKLPDTGLIKLLPRGKYPDTAVGMREGGAYYSFTRKTHEYGYGSDIELSDGRFTVGFAGGNYGYFLPLGDIPSDQLADATSEVPKWARGAAADGWAAMWGDAPLSREEISRAETAAFFRDAEAKRANAGRRGVPAEPGRSYLLRSVALDDYDILVGLRVLRSFDDGSVVIAYRLLKTFDIPRDPRDRGRPPRPLRHPPATRVP